MCFGIRYFSFLFVWPMFCFEALANSVVFQSIKPPKQVEKIHEEETKEAHKEEVKSDQNLLVEASYDDQTSKQVLTHMDEKLQEEETREIVEPEHVNTIEKQEKRNEIVNRSSHLTCVGK